MNLQENIELYRNAGYDGEVIEAYDGLVVTPDNYCDFSGMSGAHFKNYAVMGFPTLFLLDQEGVVLKKTAMVDELMTILDKKNLVEPN